ncbi:MAG: hypothetical protein PHZ11_00715 [Desulfitobacteriaceae bacterium]|nr:hypothetical protein [Desulfitobacteriaceae bacterium]MDD4345416.1 hypothetical protein [Desulfitobacteriaceae bacterium]MDD4401256.1 hypothetical protein [Desulfitobacteriaceae bacterium]
MAILNKTVYLPHQLICYEDTRYFLQINSLGCVLYNEHSSVPLYQLHEPLLLVQGVAASTQQIHLVMIKANGELCYTLINGSEQVQTTTLAKLDVRSTRYNRLLLFPLGKTVHIFYAYAHQAIPDLWHIEHRFWNGKNWHSVNLGEIVYPRKPLYDVVLDRKGNLHLIMLTYQARQTLILSNRFNGTFYLWGNTSQAFQTVQEVSEMTSIITPDNVHHIFWLAKTVNSKFELGWAYRNDIQEFTGNWLKPPAAIQTLNGPLKGLGAVEVNGSLWLLVNAEVETLLLYKGESWKQVVNNTPTHCHLHYLRRNNLSLYNTYWLEDSRDSRIPAFYQYLGLNFSARTEPSPNQSGVPETGITPEPKAIAQVEKNLQPEKSTQAKAIPNIDDYPDDLIPPVPVISDTITPGCLATKIDQPVFASLKVPTHKSEPDLENILSDKAKDLNQALVPLIISLLEPYLETRIEEIVSAIQQAKEAEKAEEQKGRKKGFWARWFK